VAVPTRVARLISQTGIVLLVILALVAYSIKYGGLGWLKDLYKKV